MYVSHGNWCEGWDYILQHRFTKLQLEFKYVYYELRPWRYSFIPWWHQKLQFLIRFWRLIFGFCGSIFNDLTLIFGQRTFFQLCGHGVLQQSLAVNMSVNCEGWIFTRWFLLNSSFTYFLFFFLINWLFEVLRSLISSKYVAYTKCCDKRR